MIGRGLRPDQVLVVEFSKRRTETATTSARSRRKDSRRVARFTVLPSLADLARALGGKRPTPCINWHRVWR